MRQHSTLPIPVAIYSKRGKLQTGSVEWLQITVWSETNIAGAFDNYLHKPSRQPRLFDLLLWSQLVCVSTLLLAAVGCTGVQPSIAPASHEANYVLRLALV